MARFCLCLARCFCFPWLVGMPCGVRHVTGNRKPHPPPELSVLQRSSSRWAASCLLDVDGIRAGVADAAAEQVVVSASQSFVTDGWLVKTRSHRSIAVVAAARRGHDG